MLEQPVRIRERLLFRQGKEFFDGLHADRIALAMLVSAEQKGELQDEVTVVEATSGNTGIALAMLCAERNHKLILTMPETMSFERRSLVARYGAEVILTPGSEDIAGAVRRAQKIIQQKKLKVLVQCIPMH